MHGSGNCPLFAQDLGTRPLALSTGAILSIPWEQAGGPPRWAMMRLYPGSRLINLALVFKWSTGRAFYSQVINYYVQSEVNCLALL